MIRLGKTFGNLMVDVVPSNEKLEARVAADRARCDRRDVSEARSSEALARPDGEREGGDRRAARRGRRGDGAQTRLEQARRHVQAGARA